MSKIKFLLSSLTGFFVVLYLLYISYIYFNQADMVFIHSSLTKEYKFNFQVPFEEKYIPSFDNSKQHGLLFKVDKPKGIIFYLHGNAGNVATWGEISNFYCSLGYDLLVLDYRSFGKSEGIIENEEQILKDVALVFNSVTKAYQKKIIIGYSIGTGIAANLASKQKAAMLILQAPYDNFERFTAEKVPFYPNFLKKFHFETDKVIQKINYPIYIFHGNNDQLISLANSKRLKNILKPIDTLFILENQEHNGMNDNLDYQNKLKILLK